ncbi:hypothetical protein NRIC_36360 [Enterococcus florum]|uniref:DUF2187 domain-containing protein n=1 Tax=Enterococcus florum TaxID=2480627 RepID=A0A4P5PC00_9ENTE|nr:hypothetical protein [Enterococcus florum]GCF95745.1 hypothetical protein NRIC_36360 [Enterococcus florum]
MENIEIGEAYQCKAIGLEKEVIGVVEQLYTNTALINVVQCESVDRIAVIERQNRLLVKYEDIYCNATIEYPA